LSKKPKKKDLMELKDLDLQDWRGLIALIVIIGGFIVIGLSFLMCHPEWASAPITLMTTVIMYYFHMKEKENSSH
jgi:hypothetical protein